MHLLWPILWSLKRYYIQHFLGLVEILLCLLLPPNKHCYDGGGGGFYSNLEICVGEEYGSAVGD